MSVRVVARLRPLLESEIDGDCIITTHRHDGPVSSSTARNSVVREAGKGGGREVGRGGDKDMGGGKEVGRGGDKDVRGGGSGENVAQQKTTPPTLVRIPNPRNGGENFTFQFNRVFEAETSQKELFEAEIKPTVKHLFGGFDVTLFAYGVTGTGKTHTMRGGKSMDDRGIIPRLLSSIYRKARSMSTSAKASTTQASISLSYYEIYKDKVYDLFEPPEKRTFAGLPLRDNGSRTVVVGLTERSCEDLKTFEKLYDQANVNRSTSATKLNAHSSRSHAILCVKLTLTSGNKTTVSTASCIDLAGSEDNRRTDNKKERLVESSAINKSLFVLSQCVEAIGNGQKRIPYRESKMTRILSLGQNNGLCICLLNLAPVRSYHLDTLSSLNFANRTKKIEIREAENEPIYNLAGKGKSLPSASLGKAPLMNRQPLRNVSGTTHSPVTGKSASGANQKTGKKQGKAFTVFRDDPKTPKPRIDTMANAPQKRNSANTPQKRNSVRFASSLPQAGGGPKTPSTPNRTPSLLLGISELAIEELVEKKVTEILAARALETPAPKQSEVDHDMRRRLEALERKVEETASRGDERAEGLSYLLMAKQHLVRGEDVSSLKMYKLAQPYFPGNEKLETKICRLREKVEAKKLTGIFLGKESVHSELRPEMFCDEDEDVEMKGPGLDGSTAAAAVTNTGPPRDGFGLLEEGSGDGDYGCAGSPAMKKRKRTDFAAARPVSDNMASLSPCARRLLDMARLQHVPEIGLLNDLQTRRGTEHIAEALQKGDDGGRTGGEDDDAGVSLKCLGERSSGLGREMATPEAMRQSLLVY